MANINPEESSTTYQLGGFRLLILRPLAWVLRLWSDTLRFRITSQEQEFLDATHKPSIILLWHNRLFAVPAFYRRYFSKRNLAVLISTSKDGAWLTAFLELIGMKPIRGSRYRRGAQSVRDLISAVDSGYDIGITPDGSRGPMYDMKPGAVSVAAKSGAPIVLLAFNYSRAIRLNNWDRFYLPMPFSKVEVCVDRVGDLEDSLLANTEEATSHLKERMQQISKDS